MRIHVVTFPSGGLELSGILHLPAGGSYERSAVVAHGLLSTKDSPKHIATCEALAASGVAALRFDFAGRGASEGRLEDLTVTREIGDLRAAVGVVRASGATRIALVGSSLGGTVAMLVGAEARLDALVTIASPARLPEAPRAAWGDLHDADRGESLGDAFFADARHHAPLDAARQVRCPWLVLHGQRDDTVPVTDGRDLAAAAGAALRLHPDAGHRFDGPGHQDWLVEAVTRFVAGHV